MVKNTTPTIQLNNSIEMPLLGLGTYRSLGAQGKAAVKYALMHGYDMIDTAQGYDNEAQVGKGWKASGRCKGNFYHYEKSAIVNRAIKPHFLRLIQV